MKNVPDGWKPVGRRGSPYRLAQKDLFYEIVNDVIGFKHSDEGVHFRLVVWKDVDPSYSWQLVAEPLCRKNKLAFNASDGKFYIDER